MLLICCRQCMGAFPPTVSNIKLSNIYSILAAFIFVCIFIISNGFHDDEGGNETANFINTPITKIPKLDDIDFSACNKTFGTTTTIVTDGFFEEHVTTTSHIDICCFPNETFASLCVASAMLAFAGLFYSAYVWRKCAPTDSSEPHESKTACIFIHRHKTPYDVDLYATVAYLKQKIGDRIGSDVIDDQYIIFAGKRLLDNVAYTCIYDPIIQRFFIVFTSFCCRCRYSYRFCVVVYRLFDKITLDLAAVQLLFVFVLVSYFV